MNMAGTFRVCLLGLIFVLMPALARAEGGALAVSGEVRTPLKLTLAELKAMPTVKVSATEHDGKTVEYEGVLLHEILRRAGAPEGESLRGGALQLGVLVKAADNYKVVFSLAELDPLFTNKQVVLAFRRNGADLDATAGPLRLVIPDEKRQARWVRQVTELEIIRTGEKGKP
jgi:DMSO/TMAO reductase YedYZ molybdopterin-dependent catalytic subunit